MDITKNTTTGLYTITLGGVLWNNCSTDADCPGAAICSVNQTWSAYPSMCHCSFIVQHEGADCTGLGPYSIAYFIINVSACIIALVWFGVSLFDLYRIIKWKRFKRDALSTSLVLTILALLMAAIQAAAVSRFSFWNPPPDANGMKDDHVPIGTVGMALTFLFATMSMLNVSLVWIQIADNAEKVRKVAAQNVTRYRTLLILYYVFFFGLMVVSLFLGSVTIAAGIAAPGILFVLITYLYAGLRMRRMLKAYLTSSSASGSHRGSMTAIQESSKNIRESLQAIQYAALAVSFISLNFILFVIIWLALGGSSNRPGKDFNQIALTMNWFWAALAPSTVMWYLHNVIEKKGKARLDGSNDRRIAVAIDATENKRPTETIPAFTHPDETTAHEVTEESKRVSVAVLDRAAEDAEKPSTNEVAQGDVAA